MPDARHRRRSTAPPGTTWKGWRQRQTGKAAVERRFVPIDGPRIVAKRDFTCARCGQSGKAGEKIVWIPPRTRRGKVVTKSQAIHDVCAAFGSD